LTFWPFRPKYAWITSVLLVPTLIALVATLQSAGVLSGDRISPQIALVAVVLGFIPVLALILERVTSVKAAGVEVTFAAVQKAVQTAGTATRTTIISGNLGTPPGSPTQDTSGGSILQAVQAGTTGEVVIVDLGDGHQWWQTRLLLLASGMSRHRPNSAIVFTAILADQPEQFIGWARSTAVLKCLLASDGKLRRAYQEATRDTNLVGLATPVQWDTSGSALETPVQLANGKALPPVSKFDEFISERMLFQHLVFDVEGGHLGHGEEVTVAKIRNLLAPILNVHSLAEEASESEKLSIVLDTNSDYLAITKKGRYVNLLPHRIVVNAVLRSMVVSERTG
jgi:hypothetical protein